MNKKRTFIFDIETSGEDFDSMDSVTQDELLKYARNNSDDEEEFERNKQAVKNRTGLNPLTGQVVTVGLLDAYQDQGAVYYQAPGADLETKTERGIKLAAMSEADMLKQFWLVMEHCGCAVGFNSRRFDAFFLNVRSAVHGIRPSVDLMSNRYLGSQRGPLRHIDLLDQLKYYGAVWGDGMSLHMWCRAFDIPTPKGDDVDGSKVAQLFALGQYLKIARYNIDDLYATRELFRVWRKCLDFQT